MATNREIQMYLCSGGAAAVDMNGVAIDDWYPVTHAGDSAEPK